jgi:tetratricopeptide (TPR) repeat protein
LEGAEAVAGFGEIMPLEVIDLLALLADKSIITVDEEPVETRYRMLETIRQYGVEKLRAAGAEQTLRERHLNFFVDLVQQAEPQLRGPKQAEWLDRLEEEHDNLRTALDWAALDRDCLERGLLLGAGIRLFWEARGHLSEGLERLERLLALAPAPSSARAKALSSAGVMLVRMGEITRAGPVLEEALSLYLELGDKWGIAAAKHNLAMSEQVTGEYARARTLYEESAALKRALGDGQGLALTLSNLGTLATIAEEHERALALCEETLTLQRELGNRRAEGWVLTNLGIVHRRLGLYEQALRCYDESLSVHRDLADQGGVARVLQNAAVVELDLGRWERAALLAEQGLGLHRKASQKFGVGCALGTLAEAVWRLGDLDRAEALYAEALPILAETRNSIDWILRSQGDLAVVRGNYQQARSLITRALALSRDAKRLPNCEEGITSLAILAIREGQLLRSARLYGAAENLRTVHKLPLAPADRVTRDQELEQLRVLLGTRQLEEGLAEGSALSWEEAIAYALGESSWPVEH